MNSDDDLDDLNAAERQAFDGLSREKIPPAALEKRTVAALKEAGLLRSTATQEWSPVRYAAAAVLMLSLLAVGFAAGAWTGRGSIPEQPDYMLLLRAAAAERQPASKAEMRDRVSEYASWAQDLGRRGELLSGEKFEDGGQLLAKSALPALEAGTAEGSIQGYFLIRSASYDEAVRIARSCPHVRHGGEIEIRRIERF